MDFPPLSVLLLTYGGSPERHNYAERTLRTTLDNLRYSGEIRVHIADDGSGEPHWRPLFEMASNSPKVSGVTLTDGNRWGYGHNYNLATQVVHREAEIVLPLEDDWELVRELNADPLVEALQDPRIGCIRLGYLGFSREYMIGRLTHIAGGTYMLLDADQAEPHVFAGHPRLELASWERTVGPWPETYVDGTIGIPTPGDTEFMVCHIAAARQGIAWPAHLARPDAADVFAHIGTVRSY